MSDINTNEIMIKAVSLIGKARGKHSENPKQALEELDVALKLMNDAVNMAGDDIDIRKERLKHFVGVTINSPKDLHETIHEDLSFFRSIYNSMSNDDKAFYYFIAGNYYIYSGDKPLGRDYLLKCISISPDSLESTEAKLILTTL